MVQPERLGNSVLCVEQKRRQAKEQRTIQRFPWLLAAPAPQEESKARSLVGDFSSRQKSKLFVVVAASSKQRSSSAAAAAAAAVNGEPNQSSAGRRQGMRVHTDGTHLGGRARRRRSRWR